MPRAAALAEPPPRRRWPHERAAARRRRHPARRRRAPSPALNAAFRGKDAPDQRAVLPGAGASAGASRRHRPGLRRLRARSRRTGQAAGATTCSTWRRMASCIFWATITRRTPRPRRWRPRERAILAGLGVADPYAERRRPDRGDHGRTHRTRAPRTATTTARPAPLRAGAAARSGSAARPKPEAMPPDADGAGSDLVDQAEAFQTLTVADVMIPRADIVALEIATPLRRWPRSSSRASTRACRSIARRSTTRSGFVHIKDVFKLIAGKMRARRRRTSRCWAACAARSSMCRPRCAPPTCWCGCRRATSTWPW